MAPGSSWPLPGSHFLIWPAFLAGSVSGVSGSGGSVSGSVIGVSVSGVIGVSVVVVDRSCLVCITV